jgi:peptide/nickel transport system substrate-binding protein
MDRRTFLKTGAAAGAVVTGGFATPAISQRAAARALRLVPHADLASLDPIWSFAAIARNAGLLVWDTLYGIVCWSLAAVLTRCYRSAAGAAVAVVHWLSLK